MILKKRICYLVLVVAVGLVVGIYLLRINHSKTNNQNSKKVDASSSQAVLTSQADWQAGTYGSGIDLNSSPGSTELTVPQTIDLSVATITASFDEADKNNVIDGNTSTGWENFDPAGAWWKASFDSTFSINSITIYCGGPAAIIAQYSTNDTDWTDINTFSGCSLVDPPGSESTFAIDPPVTLRYLRLNQVTWVPPPGADRITVYELELGGSSSATHTSASTQITNANLYEWQTFTPTYTEPANTDISFKFRTSTNSTDWSVWTASQTVANGAPLDITALVTSKTGEPGEETFYKYIQVESTLTSTDGVSTPTLSDYTIGYHTNVVPNKPTAQSVTIN